MPVGGGEVVVVVFLLFEFWVWGLFSLVSFGTRDDFPWLAWIDRTLPCGSLRCRT